MKIYFKTSSVLAILLIAVLQLSSCAIIGKFHHDVPAEIDHVQLVTWRDNAFFRSMEDGLYQKKYLPMLKVDLVSELNFMETMNESPNLWWKAKSERRPFSGSVFHNDCLLRDGCNMQKEGNKYRYSIYIFTKWPSPYYPRKSDGNEHQFDFEKEAFDIEFYVKGSQYFPGYGFQTITLTVSKESISNAIRKSKSKERLGNSN